MNYKILFEDSDILVCHKMAGIAVQTGKIGTMDLVSELKNHLQKNSKAGMQKEPYLGVIHRLDQPVEGVILFAKNPTAAAKLSKQLTQGIMNKCYYAVAAGVPPKVKDTLTDYLVKDAKMNSSYVVESAAKNKDAKESKLEYTQLKTVHIKKTEFAIEKTEKEAYSLLDIHLLTGRHHQIRVQMANAGLPLLGDKKYGDKYSDTLSQNLGVRNVALCAYKLEFTHPKSNQKTEFKIMPKGQIFEQFLPDLS